MKKTFLTLTFVLLLSLASTPAKAEALVSLRPVAEVKTAAIRLSDVFDGIPASLDQDVAIAPDPGKSVTYNVNVLVKLAEQFQLIWKPKSFTDQSVLTRAATYISPDMIRERVEAKIRALEPTDIASMEITFDNRNPGLYLPVDRDPVFDLNMFEYDMQTRRFQTEVIVPNAGQPLKQSLVGRVMVQREIPVFSQRMTGGSVVNPGDITWEIVADDRLNKDVLLSADQIVGMELRADVAAGEMIRARDMIPPRLVTRGSIVTVMVSTPLMQVTIRAKALQDGARGDVVRVSNVQSKRVLEGVVESTGVIRVETARQVAVASDAMPKTSF